MLEKFATAYGWMARARFGVTVSLLAGLLVLEAWCGAALVFADTVERNPSGDIAVSYGTVFPAAPTTHFDKVDETTADGGTSYIQATGNAQKDVFSFPAFSVPAGATSISVSVTYVAQKTAAQAASMTSLLRIGGVDYTGAAVDPANGVFTQYSDNWATNPATGSAWTIAEVNGTDGTNPLQGIGVTVTDANPQSQVTQVFVSVTYTPSGNNPIMHNSISTGSLKWSGSWGVAGGKYGEFKCTTCHQAGTSNIKRIRTALPTTADPIAPTTENFPGSTITFLDALAENTQSGAGTADFGDDARVPNTSSTNVCEVCHTNDDTRANGVKWHGYNMSAAADTTHENGTDCTSCHKHSQGFVGVGDACNACHGNPPTSGAHLAHTTVTSHDLTEDLSDCATCHVGADSYTYDAGGNHRNSIVDVGVGYNSGNGTCASACHASTVTDGFWSDANWLNCDSCHDNAPANGGADGTAHADHLTAGLTCGSCHDTTNGTPTDNTHITNVDGADEGAILTGRAQALTSEVLVGVTGWNGVAKTCNTAACHNPSGESYVADWTATTGSTSSCTLCHGDMITQPTTGSHAAHLGAATTFGIDTINCASCHADNSGNNAHRNATVDFTSTPAALGYTGGAEDVGGSLGTCNTSTCHNDGTVAATPVVSPQWGTASADCTICHGNAPATGEHAVHVANTTYVDGSCTDCHAAETAATHIDGTRNMASQVTDMDLVAVGNQLSAPGGWNGTCANSCHIADTANDWTAGTLACTDCHGSGKVTTPSLDRSWPPSTGAHAAHVGNTEYVDANCVTCHNDNQPGHSALNNVVVAPFGTRLSVYPGNGSCTNSCHLAAEAGDWTGGSAVVTCTDCHSGTYIGGNNVAKGFNATPSSGLHTGTLTITANTHDDSFDDGNAGIATCVTCHTATPSSAHLNGVLTVSAPTINFNANLNFTDGTTPTCGPTGVGFVTCHDDGGVWQRKWSTTARTDAVPNNECANCHGDFASGFVVGMTLRHQTSTSGDLDGGIGANHDGTDKCYTCHNYKAGDTTYYNFATDHRDGAIRLNDNAGITDNGATIGCSSCHAANDGTADGGHEFVATTARWTRQPVAGPAADCNSCHTASGRTHSDASESLTIHNLHVASGYTAGCTYCHSNAGPGDPAHNNGTVNFGGTYMTSAADYSAAAFGGSCLNSVNGCHDSDISGEWASGDLGADSCADCHAATGKLLSQGAYPPTSNEHTQHLANNVYVPNDCTDCHGAGATTGAHAGHKDTLKTIAAEISLYTPANGTCTNNCHTVVEGCGWTDASTLGCNDCHSATGKTLDQGGFPPASNAHTAHLDNNALVPNDCTDCHGTNATAGTHTGHMDGAKTIGSQVSVYTAVDGTCTNTCHAVVDTRDWTSATSLNCADCHAATGKSLDQGGYPPVSAKHTVHLANNSYVPNDCTDCHGANATAGTHAGHKDGTTQNSLTYASATQTCTTSCHLANTTGDWTAGGVLTCTDCHAGTYIGGAGNMPTSGLHNVTPTVTGQRHDQTVSGGCAACHTSVTAQATHVNGAFTGNGTLAGDRTNMGLAAFYTNGGTDNTGTCLTSGCHTGRDDWQHKWTSAAGAYTTDVTACANCHGLNTAVANLGTTGVVHRAVTAKHTNGTSYTCRDCHAIEGVGYTYTWNSNDWGGTSHHGNDSVEINNNNVTYNQTSGLCTNCHTVSDGTHNFVDTAWTINSVAGTAISIACGECHTGGVTTSAASGAHTAHNAGIAALVAGGADCTPCHGNNGGLGYQNTLAGTHGDDSVNFASVTYSTATRNDLTGTCLTAGCHNVNTGLDQSTAWNSSALDCNDCHYYASTTTPTAAGNTAHGRPLSADHGNHFGTGGSFACADCHGADPVAGDTSHINGTTTLADKAVATQDEANVIVATWNDTTNSCANSCHNPSGESYSAVWQTSTVSCNLCHGDMTTYPTSGSHNQHLGAATLFGINTIACTSCHADNTGNNAHLDSTVDVLAGMNYAASSCSTTTCHNNGAATPVAVATPTWGTASADCTICHGNAPATGEHAKHFANTTFVDGGCVDCHTAANTTTHINGVRNISGQITDMDLGTGGNQLTAPGGWNGTCANACHIANTAGDWTAGTNTLACADCHGSGKVTTPAMDRGWPPASGAHAAHLGNTAYVTGANCVNCHNNNTVTHSTLNNVVTSALGTSISVNGGNGSCTNSCHSAAQAGDWTGGSAAITCTDCHSGTFIGGGANNRTSGLHNVTPTVTGQRHDNTVAGGCASCHTTIMAQATHIAGTFTGGNGQTAQMGLAGFYTQTADNTGTCATTACHTGRDDWAHKWTSTAGAYTTNVTACANCHGDNVAGFNSGTVHRTSVKTWSKHGTGTTYACKDCHNLEAASGYTYTWNTNDWGGTSSHGDGNIQVNSTGTSFNQTNGTCESCHTNNGTFNFLDTGWTIALAAGDSINTTCGECHTGGKTPGSSSGAHDMHGASLADETTCYVCHGDNAGSGYAVYTGTHNNGSVNFANVTYSTAVRNAVTGTCLTAGCHNVNTGTDQSTAWNSTALDCDDCHYYAATTTPTAAGNTAHGRPLSADHGNHFGTGGSFACADCHGADPVAGDTSHINGTTTLADKAVATQDEANVTVATWNDTTNSCANAACHNPSGTTYSATWQVSTVSCALCHSTTDPTTGSHTAHMGAATLFGINTVACTSCHTDNSGNNRHLNNTVNMLAGMNYAALSCSTTTCHNNGMATPVAVATPTWGTASPNCTICHVNPPATGEHTIHVANTSYVNGSCADCHPAATATTHINGARNVAAEVSAYTPATGTCTNTCHAVADGRDWTSATSLTCTDCHSSTYIGSGANGPSSGLHNITPTISGQRHDATLAGGCASCHTTVTAQATHVNGAFTGNGTLAGDRTNMGLAAFYTNGGTDNTGTCLTTGCHTGRDDWAHKWTSAVGAYTTDVTACANCHGMNTTFNTGVVHRDSVLTWSTHGTGTSYSCKDCHALEATTNNYTFAFGTNDWGGTSQHGNGSIEVNNVATSYNETTGYCAQCHASEGSNFLDTGWPILGIAGDGISGSCSSCHAYPPTPGDGKTAQAIESKGAHAKHVTHIAARAGVTLNPDTDTFTGVTSTAVCGVCHDVSTDLNHNTAGGARHLAIPVTLQFGATPPTFNGTVGVSSSTDPKSCSSVDCHFRETPIWAPVAGE